MTSEMSTAHGLLEAALTDLAILSQPVGPECLSTNECIELLRHGGLGRVGVVAAGVAVVVPVNFIYLDGFIEFRTNIGTKLYAVLTAGAVSFEIDHHDPSVGQGWSVLAIGAATATTDPAEIAAAAHSGLHAEAPGTREYLVKLRPVIMTGRRFGHYENAQRLHPREP